jgi:hypothetical protein
VSENAAIASGDLERDCNRVQQIATEPPTGLVSSSVRKHALEQKGSTLCKSEMMQERDEKKNYLNESQHVSKTAGGGEKGQDNKYRKNT